MKRRKVTSVTLAKPGSPEDRETGTRRQSKVPRSITHRKVSVGAFSRWVKINSPSPDYSI